MIIATISKKVASKQIGHKAKTFIVTICNIVGTHYEIAFGKEFVYQNADAIAI